MKLAPVIALFGLSGVGKTWLAHTIVERKPDILLLSASELLRSYLLATDDQLRTAPREIVRENQHALAAALAKVRECHPSRPILLDGHSVIDNDKELIDVPTSVIRTLGVEGILFLEAAPEIIAERRLLDSKRRPARGVEELKEQQRHARGVAERFAYELEVPIRIIGSDEVADAVVFIDDILRAGA